MVDPRPALPIRLLVAGLLLVSGCASTPAAQPQDPLALGNVPDDRPGASQVPTGSLVSHRTGSQVIGGSDLGTIPTVGGGAPAPASGALSLGSGGS